MINDPGVNYTNSNMGANQTEMNYKYYIYSKDETMMHSLLNEPTNKFLNAVLDFSVLFILKYIVT